MTETDKVRWVWGYYTREDLMKMDPVLLRAILCERTHHGIEVPLYPTLLKGKGNPIQGFGREAKLALEVWRERGLPEDAADIEWVKKNLAVAEKIRLGEKIEWDEPLPTPFTDEEMAVVYKLLWGRRSMRDFMDKEIPDDMIEKILEAGRAAPCACNLCQFRFIVLKTREEIKMIKSDFLTEHCVIIMVCYDKRISQVTGHDRLTPQNPGMDAAAAGDHMCLMAHALGLGACWVSRVEKTEKTPDTAKLFAEEYGLPDHIGVALHIVIGWPAIGTIKSERVPLEDLMIRRNV